METGRSKTHLGGLKMSQLTRAMKWWHKAISSVQECPRNISNKHVVKMNALCWNTSLGGLLDLPEELRVVKDIWDWKNVVDGNKINRIGPRNEKNEPAVKTNMQCWDREPGSQEDDWIESESVEHYWSGKNNVEGTRYNGRSCQKDGNECNALWLKMSRNGWISDRSAQAAPRHDKQCTWIIHLTSKSPQTTLCPPESTLLLRMTQNEPYKMSAFMWIDISSWTVMSKLYQVS